MLQPQLVLGVGGSQYVDMYQFIEKGIRDGVIYVAQSIVNLIININLMIKINHVNV